MPSVRLYSYCDGVLAEIWCTKGWATLEVEMPRFYTKFNSSIYLVFDEITLHNINELSYLDIKELVRVQLENDIGLPPRTEFTRKWFYRLDYSQDKVYSRVDSLFKYDDPEFNENRKSYTGKALCY